MAKYFTISELIRSDTAKRQGISNNPTPDEIESIWRLMNEVLDPIRENYGKPIYVTSGYRSPALNRAVGGSQTSQHMRGEAADIDTPSRAENKRLFEIIVDMLRRGELTVGQLIWEKGNSEGPDWIHVSLGVKNQIIKL